MVDEELAATTRTLDTTLGYQSRRKTGASHIRYHSENATTHATIHQNTLHANTTTINTCRQYWMSCNGIRALQSERDRTFREGVVEVHNDVEVHLPVSRLTY